MTPYTQQINEGKIYRTFISDVNSDELKWHQDLNDRKVRILESGGWRYQEEDSLPINLKENQEIFIQSGKWHRVIKGNGKLIVEITES